MPERINAGHALAAIGGALLLVSLFLDWYEPGFTAWTVFEVVDLALAALALVALAAFLQEVWRARRPGTPVGDWLPAAAIAALALVVASIVNNPPAVTDRGEEAGAWVALAGSILMLLGAALARRRISLVISVSSGRQASTPTPRADRGPVGGTTGPATEPPGSETETRPL